MKKQDKQSGAVIIEATITLTTFMFAIVTILFVSHICYAQSKIGTVIDGVTKDLSEFSYIYSLTGLAEKHSKLSSEAGQAKESLDNVVDNLSDVTDTLGNLKELGSSLINDSEMRSSMMSLLKNEAANKAESLATAFLVKHFAKGRLAGTSGDCEIVLKRLGVENTHGTYLDSIDFGDSVFCVNGSSEIKVVARYSVKLITLLNIDIDFDIVQCAATKAWGAAKKADAEVADSSGGDGGSEDETKPDEEETETTEPTEPTEPTIKSPEEYAKDATQNDDAPQVMLGKYENSVQGQSYIMTAIKFNATYFDLADYDEIKAATSEDYMWNINKAFLEQQYAQGKQFLLTDDPSKATGSYKKEVLWLQDKGYSFEYDAGTGIWKAVKSGG